MRPSSVGESQLNCNIGSGLSVVLSQVILLDYRYTCSTTVEFFSTWPCLSQ